MGKKQSQYPIKKENTMDTLNCTNMNPNKELEISYHYLMWLLFRNGKNDAENPLRNPFTNDMFSLSNNRFREKYGITQNQIMEIVQFFDQDISDNDFNYNEKGIVFSEIFSEWMEAKFKKIKVNKNLELFSKKTRQKTLKKCNNIENTYKKTNQFYAKAKNIPQALAKIQVAQFNHI